MIEFEFKDGYNYDDFILKSAKEMDVLKREIEILEMRVARRKLIEDVTRERLFATELRAEHFDTE